MLVGLVVVSLVLVLGHQVLMLALVQVKQCNPLANMAHIRAL